MKKLYSKLAAMLLLATSFAANADCVYLNNGTMIEGKIEHYVENGSVVIKSLNGQQYTYDASQVRKVTFSEGGRLPNTNAKRNTALDDYTLNETGFWWTIEGAGAYSLNMHHDNIAFGQLTATAGYRFNEYFKVGAGLGLRYYFNNEQLRSRTSAVAFPVFVNVRGNFIPTDYRTVVPFYSVDAGTVIFDGAFFNPSIGVRFGEKRSAFTLGVSYWGQCTKSFESMDFKLGSKTRFVQFMGLKLGYEF